MKVKVGQIVENVLQDKKRTVVVCRVIELNVAGTDMVRLADVRDKGSDAQLITGNKTWAAPLENIRWHDEAECSVCQER